MVNKLLDDYKNIFKYIDIDITNNLTLNNDDTYKLYLELNGYKYIIFANKFDMNKFLFLLPLFKYKTFLLSELTVDKINRLLQDNKSKNNHVKFKTATCTVIKDEQQYLEEWINHNLSIGFDEIWLFEDYGSIPHNDICDKYPQVHLNKLSDIKYYIIDHKQTDTWNYFINEYKGKFDWVAFIDVDEFIMFEEGWNLQKLLNHYKNEGGIYLFWKMFNANGHIDNPKKSVVEVFKEECDIIKTDNHKWNFKSIVNLNKNNKMITNHECLYGISTNDLSSPYNTCHNKSWINHYFTRSWEEWCDRFVKRGDICKNIRKLYQFFELNKNMIPFKKDLMEKYFEYKSKYKKLKKLKNIK